MPVTAVKSGQTASFSLKKIKRSQIRKGMVMVNPGLEPQCCYEFEGEILVLHHPTTISCKYQAMVHCGSIRQTASIIRMSSECLRTGDKAQVLFRYLERADPLMIRFHVKTFRFVKHPEFLKEGQRLVFREGRTKAVGNVSKIIPYIPATVAKDQKSKSHQVCRQFPNFLIKTFSSSGPGRRKEKDDGSEQSNGSDTTAGPGTSLTR